MATDYTNLTLQARAEARDLVDSNPVVRETPSGGRDGSATVFYLDNKNIVSGIVSSVQYGPWVTYGTNQRSLSDGSVPFTLDSLNGIVTMGTAPDDGTTQPFFIDYYFQWFTDANYVYWIDRATEELGQTAGSFTGAVAGGGSLTPALIQYVLERFWKNRASQYANKYATSTASASEDIQTVTDNFLNLAKNARKNGDMLRKFAYVDPGQKQKAASGTITYTMSPYTPRR